MNKPRNRPSNRHSDANRTADREDYDRVALAWFRLAQRWGSYDQLLAAMELFLQSTLDDDHEGTRRSVLLLRLLPSLPKLDKSVGLLLKRES